MGKKRLIEIDAGWYLEPDVHSWNLVHRYEQKAKGDQINTCERRTYHATLEEALNSYANEVLKRSESVSALMDEIGLLKDQIRQLFAGGIIK